jgi:hypothetical protein
LLPPTGAAVVGAAVTALADELVPLDAEELDEVGELVGLAEVLAVEVVGVEVVGVEVVGVAVGVLVLPDVVVPVVVVAVVDLAASWPWVTPETSATTRATAPAVAPEPTRAARRSRRLAGVDAFIATTITPGASGQPHHNVKCVLTSLRSWAWTGAAEPR